MLKSDEALAEFSPMSYDTFKEISNNMTNMQFKNKISK